MKTVARENYKRSAPERTGILVCAIAQAKKVAVSESHEITRLAYLGEITNIGGGRARKLLKECSWEGRDISLRDWARERGDPLGLARNRTGSIFRPNNEYW